MLLAQGLVSPVRTSPACGIVIFVQPLSFSDCLTSQPLTLLFMPPVPGTVQFLCGEWINQVIRMNTRVTRRKKKGVVGGRPGSFFNLGLGCTVLAPLSCLPFMPQFIVFQVLPSPL